jgi:SAM-dependent methyltransferase
MNIDWKTKSGLLWLIDLLGGDLLYFVQKRITRRAVVALPTIPLAWRFHEGTLDRYRPERLIEFGAGKNLGQNIYLARPGLAQQVVDLHAMLDLTLVNHVIGILSARHARAGLTAVSSLEDLQSCYGIAYRAPVDMARTDFADASFDLCVSTNTLEHIPVATLEAILHELRRILKAGGIVSAQIDYSDHYAHTDKSISKLNYLRFSDAQWRRHNHRCFHQNRLRHNHYRRLFVEAGFAILHQEALRPCETLPPALEPALLTGDDSDFCKLGHWVLKNP